MAWTFNDAIDQNWGMNSVLNLRILWAALNERRRVFGPGIGIGALPVPDPNVRLNAGLVAALPTATTDPFDYAILQYNLYDNVNFLSSGWINPKRKVAGVWTTITTFDGATASERPMPLTWTDACDVIGVTDLTRKYNKMFHVGETHYVKWDTGALVEDATQPFVNGDKARRLDDGFVCERIAGVWVAMTNPKGVEPDVIVTTGLIQPYDILGYWIAKEIRDILKLMVWTPIGYSGYYDGAITFGSGHPYTDDGTEAPGAYYRIAYGPDGAPYPQSFKDGSSDPSFPPALRATSEADADTDWFHVGTYSGNAAIEYASESYYTTGPVGYYSLEVAFGDIELRAYAPTSVYACDIDFYIIPDPPSDVSDTNEADSFGRGWQFSKMNLMASSGISASTTVRIHTIAVAKPTAWPTADAQTTGNKCVRGWFQHILDATWGFTASVGPLEDPAEFVIARWDVAGGFTYV